MVRFNVGCPMWAHRPWVGRWYPSTVRPGTELEFYSRLCNSVEGNTTFYAEPSADAVSRWRDQTPPEFRFAFKVPRTVTHDRRLRDVAEPVRSFLDRIEPLGSRLGPVQVQLPPAFGPEGIDVLERFLRRLPRDWTWALELRHPGWFDGADPQRRLDEVLIDRDISRVVLDTRPLYAAPAESEAAIDERNNKPKLPITLDAIGSRPIIRVIGEDRSDGSLRGLKAWSDHVVRWLDEGRQPFVFVHQPENLDSPELARRLHAHVADLVPSLDRLAEPAVEGSPDQASLF